MKQAQQTAQHTPGPLHYAPDGQMILIQDGQMVVAECRGWGYLTGACGLNLSPKKAAAIQDASGRLFAAAYNSYDKHCGPNAVACAEADLLGELFRVAAMAEELRQHAAATDDLHDVLAMIDLVASRARTALAKATTD